MAFHREIHVVVKTARMLLTDNTDKICEGHALNQLVEISRIAVRLIRNP